MDRAYEGDAMRQLALDLGFVPVVPPRSSRLTPWNYNRLSIAAAMRLNAYSVA
jgi:hypothetical protein